MMDAWLVIAMVTRVFASPGPVSGCYTVSAGPWSRPGVPFRIPGFVHLRADSATASVNAVRVACDAPSASPT